jgi:hypothetical protein
MSVKFKIKLTSLIVSFLYVSLGTLTAMVSYPNYEFLGFNYDSYIWLPLAIVTLPVNFLLFILIMVDNSISSILLLQIPIFFICWWMFYKLFKLIFKIK